jgi:hypothetical protein
MIAGGGVSGYNGTYGPAVPWRFRRLHTQGVLGSYSLWIFDQ